MTTKAEKKYREALKLFFWTLGLTGISALMIYSGFYWLHSIAMIAVGAVVGPVSAFVCLFMGLMAIGARLEMKK